MRADELPTQGVLQGVKVLSTGSAIAGPMSATLLSELGADTIHVEHPRVPDSARAAGGFAWDTVHLNQRNVALDMFDPAARPAFERLLAWADVWVEASKPGALERRALTDADVWGIKPELVIVHISGYGQTGDPAYVQRPGYDAIAQAFSGFMNWNGMPEPAPPLRVKPVTADYVTGIFGALAASAALYRAKLTGVGESVDIAQFEAMLRIQGHYLTQVLNGGRDIPRTGNQEADWGVYDTFVCGDGSPVMVVIAGNPAWRRARTLFGLEDDPDFPEELPLAIRDTPAFDKGQSAVADFCASRSAEEVETELLAIGLACSRLLTPDDMLAHPHFQARESIAHWYDHVGQRDYLGPAIVGQYTNNPTKVWRHGPKHGEDTVDILTELGLSADAQAELIASGVAKDGR